MTNTEFYPRTDVPDRCCSRSLGLLAIASWLLFAGTDDRLLAWRGDVLATTNIQPQVDDVGYDAIGDWAPSSTGIDLELTRSDCGTTNTRKFGARFTTAAFRELSDSGNESLDRAG